ncbi:PGPGW domain-containing protein [Nocardiopsis sediminis]|uniref:PGPGW domain-containing protein n=1 Tax=Nocardiopsis sediminis TaxID=1778267 RepID=A0ABV8FSQ2_9ACTN
MSPSPMTGTDDPDPAASRGSLDRTRRWRRLRARLRVWRMRMHAHPLLSLTWRTAVAVVGGAILVAGIVMSVTPGPGWAAIILGLAVLSTEFRWAKVPLRLARRWAHRARVKAHEIREERARKRRRKRG